MIQLRSILDISDNTGAQKGQCIKVFNKSKNQTATTGNIILVAIQKTKNKNKSKKIYKKELHKAMIVRVKKRLNRYDGSSIKFNKNCAILLKKETQKNVYYPVSTRILGPVSNELRLNLDNNSRILSIASRNI